MTICLRKGRRIVHKTEDVDSSACEKVTVEIR